MKIRLTLLLFATLVAVPLMADEITFSFIAQNNGITVTADSSELKFGPALNILVSDATTGASFNLAGTVSGNTGPASSFVITSSPNLVIASFDGSGVNSVLIKNGGGTTILSGEMRDNASLLSTYPNGHGAFLAGFTVDFVDPSVLALFGLGPAWDDAGAVSLTAANSVLVGSQLQGTLGGGTVTITTPTPEPGTLGLTGSGLIACAGLIRCFVKA